MNNSIVDVKIDAILNTPWIKQLKFCISRQPETIMGSVEKNSSGSPSRLR